MRLSLVLVLTFSLLHSLKAQEANSNPPKQESKPAPRATAVSAAELAAASGVSPAPATNTTSTIPAPLPSATPPPDQAPTVANGVTVHWYGHGFVYLTSSVGVRAAIDPFGPRTVKYKFPPSLTADFILISHESEDHAASDLLFGNTLNFRSVTAVGLNRANGIPFRGTALQIPKGESGANTAFSLKFDGITFCYLGNLRGPLLPREVESIGHADIVFLPVGLMTPSVKELNNAALDLGARVIIPIEYKTDFTGDLPLRSLQDYLSDTHFPLVRVPVSEKVFSLSTLPNQTTIYQLSLPPQ